MTHRSRNTDFDVGDASATGDGSALRSHVGTGARAGPSSENLTRWWLDDVGFDPGDPDEPDWLGDYDDASAGKEFGRRRS